MYRARLEDRRGDRWSIVTRTVESAVAIAQDQQAEIVWVKRIPGSSA